MRSALGTRDIGASTAGPDARLAPTEGEPLRGRGDTAVDLTRARGGATLRQSVADDAPPHTWRRPTILIPMLIAMLAPLAIVAREASRRREGNVAAMQDVIAAGRALRELDDAVEMTIAGPDSSALPRTHVSAGTILFVRRSPDGSVYVRGSHDNGDATYFYYGRELYVAPKQDAVEGVEQDG